MSTQASLLKLKSLLNLIISDLLRIVYIIILFVVIVAAVFGVFLYQQWFPGFSSYLQSLEAPSVTP